MHTFALSNSRKFSYYTTDEMDFYRRGHERKKNSAMWRQPEPPPCPPAPDPVGILLFVYACLFINVFKVPVKCLLNLAEIVSSCWFAQAKKASSAKGFFFKILKKNFKRRKM